MDFALSQPRSQVTTRSCRTARRSLSYGHFVAWSLSDAYSEVYDIVTRVFHRKDGPKPSPLSRRSTRTALSTCHAEVGRNSPMDWVSPTCLDGTIPDTGFRQVPPSVRHGTCAGHGANQSWTTLACCRGQDCIGLNMTESRGSQSNKTAFPAELQLFDRPPAARYMMPGLSPPLVPVWLLWSCLGSWSLGFFVSSLPRGVVAVVWPSLWCTRGALY